MSDGISEGYRCSEASDAFERLWKNAQADHILLSLKDELNHLSVGDLVTRLIGTTNRITISNKIKFQVDTPYGIHYTNYSRDPNLPKVTIYEVDVSASTHRKFESTTLEDTLKEALLFTEWLETPEGIFAVKVKNDY